MKVFVYGTLKKGFGNHHLLKDASYLGTHITEPKYTMYSMDGFPAVSPIGTTRIIGEVYEITTEILEDLDRLEGYPGWYSRETIITKYEPAYIYLMPNLENTYRPIVESGEWL